MILFYLAIPAIVVVTIYYTVTSMLSLLIDRSGKRYSRVLRRWSRALLWLLRVKATVRGTENIDRSTSYVYLANHSSYLDIIAVGATIPDDLRFIFKRELARIPIFGWGLALGPFILIDRADARNAMASIEKAAAQIASGASVVIFPEGTRTHDGMLGQFKRGGFMLATKSGVSMVPVAISGTYNLLPRHDWRVRPGKVEVIIGKPIEGRKDLNRAEEQAVQRRVREQLLELLGQSEPIAVTERSEREN